MKKFWFDSIGTHLEILIDSDNSIDILKQEIESRISLFEEKYSRFISDNWLHKLNNDRIGILDLDGMNMLSKMLDIAKNTDGYFDPTIGKILTKLWYGSQWIMKNEKQWIHWEKWFGDYRDIEIIENRIILHGDIELEFGWIGKGYLIDIIHEIIGKSEFHSDKYMINFGGDIYGSGGWNIGLESPFASDEVIGTIVLNDLFLACSAGTKRKWGNHHHLIDPHTGESAREVVASYVEWESGMMTDGYATALCVMPWKIACEILKKTPEISGVIVSKDGEIFQKEGSKSEIFS